MRAGTAEGQGIAGDVAAEEGGRAALMSQMGSACHGAGLDMASGHERAGVCAVGAHNVFCSSATLNRRGCERR